MVGVGVPEGVSVGELVSELVMVGDAVLVAVEEGVPVGVDVGLLLGVLVITGVAVLVGVLFCGWVGFLLPQALMKRTTRLRINTAEK
jgi:hypothetical protein